MNDTQSKIQLIRSTHSTTMAIKPYFVEGKELRHYEWEPLRDVSLYASTPCLQRRASTHQHDCASQANNTIDYGTSELRSFDHQGYSIRTSEMVSV